MGQTKVPERLGQKLEFFCLVVVSALVVEFCWPVSACTPAAAASGEPKKSAAGSGATRRAYEPFFELRTSNRRSPKLCFLG